MSTSALEDRLAFLEAEVARLKVLVEGRSSKRKHEADWLDKIWGSFANDPIYEEAMRLGREYRESLRPQGGKREHKKPKRRVSR